MPKKRANGEGNVCERRRWRMKRAKGVAAAPLAAPNGGRELQRGNRMKVGGCILSMAKKKRANGEGSIRKRKDGRWEGRYMRG